MFEIKIKNHKDETLNFNDRNYTVYQIDGLANVNVDVHTSANSTTDGSSVSNSRLNNRNIVIYIKINGNVEENRINLYRYFALKKDITIYFKNGSRDVCIVGQVNTIECNLFSQAQIMQVSLICAEPYFKSLENKTDMFADISSLFYFPFSIAKEGMEFSALTTNQKKSIYNAGDIDTGAIIELYALGTVINPVIYDNDTREKMALNITMLPTDKIIINTNVGQKSITLIRDGVAYNGLGYLSLNSDWLVIKSGDNVFSYEAKGGTTNLQITFKTSVLYGGV